MIARSGGFPFWRALASASLLTAILPSLRAADDYESAPQVTAASLLEPVWLQSSLHQVEPQVDASRPLYVYRLRVGGEVYEVRGTEILKMRVREFHAIAALREKGLAGAAAKGLASQGGDLAVTLATAAKQPVQSIVDVPRGLVSIGKRSAKSTESQLTEGGNYSGGAVRDWFQISSYKLEVAAQAGVDPYSDNQALQAELNRLSTAGAAGGLGLRLAVPGDGLIAASQQGASAARLEDVYLTPPSELYQENARLLGELGVPKERIEKFLSHSVYSPADQSLIVRTLAGLGKVSGVVEFLDNAELAGNRLQCLLIRRSTEMLKALHDAGHPVTAVGGIHGFPVGITADRTLVAPVYLDHAMWTPQAAEFIAMLRQFQNEKGCANSAIVTPGVLSERLRAKFAEERI